MNRESRERRRAKMRAEKGNLELPANHTMTKENSNARPEQTDYCSTTKENFGGENQSCDQVPMFLEGAYFFYDIPFLYLLLYQKKKKKKLANIMNHSTCVCDFFQVILLRVALMKVQCLKLQKNEEKGEIEREQQKVGPKRRLKIQKK